MPTGVGSRSTVAAVNPLGMTRDACAAALAHYLGQVGYLAETVAKMHQDDSRVHAEALLATLTFHVDADVALRSGPEGQSRLSEIETAIFEPAVRRMQRTIQETLPTRASAQWLPELMDLEHVIRAALVMTAQWSRPHP
jgi:hypothetical protein